MVRFYPADSPAVIVEARRYPLPKKAEHCGYYG
jgi:hypothetical protein